MPAAQKKVHNIMLEAALRYARAGFDVVLLHGVDPKTKRCTCQAPDWTGDTCGGKGAGKHPRIKAWTKAATRDEAKLTRLLTRYPDSNIGIIPKKGTLVIDVDPRNGGDVSDWNLPPDTPTQLTGGGGAHYIVQWDGSMQLPPKRKGVDYRYAGRNQIVVEPSIHASGGRYVWEPGCDYTAKPRLWRPSNAQQRGSLQDLQGAHPSAPELTPLVPVAEALDAPIGVVGEWLGLVPSDEYGDWINAGQALKHAFGDDGLDLWDEWSQRSSKYPGRAALEKKWESFDKNRDRALRTLRSIRHMAQRHGWRYTPPELEFSSDLWRSGLVADLVAETPPAQEWVVGTVLPRGKVVMLGGPGGAGKSFLMLVLALQHTLGTPLLGAAGFEPVSPVGHRKVISFTAEDDRDDVHRRLHSVFDAYMLAPEARESIGHAFSIRCTRGQDWSLVEDVAGKLVASKTAELIIDKLRGELGLSLIMFDPSVMFSGIEENDNAAAAAYMRVLDRIARELNCAVLVGTHTNKGAVSAESVDQSSLRGASAFVDNARGAWILRTMTEEEAMLHAVQPTERHRFTCLRVAKNNYGPAGATVWLERVAGGALRLAVLPSLNGPARGDGTPGTAMPPIAGDAGSKAQRRRSGARAAAMQAHALEVMRYIDTHADPLIGGVSMSVRALARELWSSDATLTSHGMLDRARRVLDYCEGQEWLKVNRPSDDDRVAHTPSTYVVTLKGKEQFE